MLLRRRLRWRRRCRPLERDLNLVRGEALLGKELPLDLSGGGNNTGILQEANRCSDLQEKKKILITLHSA